MELNDDVIKYGVKCAMSGATNVLESLLYDETIEMVARELNVDAWAMAPEMFAEEHGTEADVQYRLAPEEVQKNARDVAVADAKNLLGILFVELK